MADYLTDLFGLQGKVAALTGAGGFLISEMSRGLSKAGVRVALLDKNREAVEKVRQEIESEIFVSEPLGNETIVDIKFGKDIIKVIADADFPGVRRDKIWIGFDSTKLHLFHKETGELLFHASDNALIQISPSGQK